jgi:hypothetical protein
MLTLNDVLRAESIDPKDIQVVRHYDSNQRTPNLYAVWMSADRPRFDEYQKRQSKKVFVLGGYLASFVVTPPPMNETVFVGLYHVKGMDLRARQRNPIYGNDFDGYCYRIAKDGRMSEYEGHLVIEWDGSRNFCQYASRKSWPIKAIRDTHMAPRWPGFAQFWMDLEDIPGIYPEWAMMLSSQKGVYVLVDRKTGELYVGSAKGAESLLGRFQEYARTGHGGNRELMARKDAHYRVGILQIVDTDLSDVTIERIEAEWKTKLMTRDHGLNAN